MNKEKFKEILEAINEVCNSSNVIATADKRLEVAQRIYVSEEIEKNQGKKQEPISEKQKKYLKDLKYKGDLNISKKEAQELIKKLKKRS